MKYSIKIGVICLARYTYDVEAALEVFQQAQQDMNTIEQVEWIIAEQPVVSKQDAQEAAHLMLQNHVDGIAVISGTFHLGHLALTIDRMVKKPVLLWAFQELPYNGGKIRLNSVCGVNLNASNLYKSGNDTYHCVVSNKIDRDWVDAIRMKAVLEQGHVGIAGYRADGFFNLGVDELRNFQQTGVLLDHYELEEMYAAEVSEQQVKAYETELLRRFNCDDITEEQRNKVAVLCCKTEKFLEHHQLDGLAIRCWPEYAATYGISPCVMMSLLQAKGRILACEGDVEGAMTMLTAQAAGAISPFLADLSQVNVEENYALMWHCGVAPANLCDEVCVPTLDTYFAGGKGVTAGFVLKSGEVNIMRIDSARGKTRLFLGKGTALPMKKELAGTYAKVEFTCSITDLLQTVTTTGVAHHVALVYGDYLKAYRIFAKLMGWEIIEV